MGTFMKSDVFQKTFLPVPKLKKIKGWRPSLMLAHWRTRMQRAASAHNERELANIWAKWMNAPDNRPCPGYQLHLSQDRWDKGDADRLKVDGAIHPANSIPQDGRPHWEKQSGLIEFKVAGTKADPYDGDDTSGAEATAQTRVDARGQLTAYVAHAFAHQHRTAVFLLLVNGTRLRATRWDRSGTIFTESFDYTENPGRLRDILWGFALAQEKEQGIDVTAVPLEPEDHDYKLMDAIAEPCADDISEEEGTIVENDGPYTFKFVRDAFRNSLAHDFPRYRVSIPVAGGMRQYLVAKPDVVAPGMSGRGTRGFIAYDMETERFTFLKDAWRPFYENVQTEGEVLRQLKKAGVCNVPTIVCDGELDHCTETPKYAEQAAKEAAVEVEVTEAAKKSRAKGKAGKKRAREPEADPTTSHRAPGDFADRGKNIMRYFRHYRLVVEEVCLPISSIKNGKELIRVVRDCVQAHADAVQKTNILHRDISAGNVMIYPTVVTCENGERRVVHKGMLIDWELSKPMTLPGMQHDVRQPCRTGTWQFTSVHLLDHPRAHVEIADELESMFFIILYVSLRYLRSTCVNVQEAMSDYFDACATLGTEYRCGAVKRFSIETGLLPRVAGKRYEFLDDRYREKHPINDILHIMLGWFQARYTKINAAEDAESEEAESEDAEKEDAETSKRAAILARNDATIEHLGQQKLDARAAKLDNHVALLNILDDFIALSWPTKDVLGDIINNPSLAHVKQIVQKRTDVEDESPKKKRSRTSKRSAKQPAVTFASEDEDEEDEDMDPATPPPPPPPRKSGRRPRTRGVSGTRPVTRASSSRNGLNR